MQTTQAKTTEPQHDGSLQVAVGKSRREMHWKNVTMMWSELVAKLLVTTRTRETVAQYKRMSKDEQGDHKDVGGFVGGLLKSGRRKSGSVAWRSMLTLDADYADAEFIPTIETLFGNAAVVYSTHSHTPDNYRLRLVAPLLRQVTPDEYKAISRFTAAEIGIDVFDDSTYEPERLMYWPSTASDGEFLSQFIDGPWLDPDAILRRHPDWQDVSTWPESSRATKIREKHAEKQGDPREKPGVVGAFCRTYSVTAAIKEFLPEIYTPCDQPLRYTYTAGTGTAGVVIYDNDLFAFSHHGTDPAGGQLCNAFDLVRLHKFGIRDDDAAPDTAINKLPSYQAMTAWAVKLDAVRVELANTRAAEAADDFEAAEELAEIDKEAKQEKPDAWKSKLQYGDRGGLQQSINNAMTCLRHDPKLKGVVAENMFTRRRVMVKSSPWREVTKPDLWRDSDDSTLRWYLERNYGLTKREAIADALSTVAMENAYHPVRQYLDRLTWDGTDRIDTLLIDYCGADDTPYVRAVSRKWILAAVSRIREPGCKFDEMLVLVGGQGMGKSTFFSRLAKRAEWFSDSITRIEGTKETMEQLSGKWIIEMGEMTGMKKAETEAVKAFLSKNEDSYRPAFARYVDNFPRQCVFGGTSNRDDFLQDPTGGRRWWPVNVKDMRRMWAEMTPEVVDQIWAEADAAYSLGEALTLPKEVQREASETQERFTELGGKAGVAEEFLDRLVPTDWYKWDIDAKLEYLSGTSFEDPTARTMKRDLVSGIELFVECFNGRIEEYTKMRAYEMTDIFLQLGWKRSKSSPCLKGYGKQRAFVRQEQEEQAQNKK